MIELATLSVEHNIRFIYRSTAGTYGVGRNGFDDDHALLDSLRPHTKHSGTKHFFDLWAYRNQYLDKIVGLKLSDVYGPKELKIIFKTI